MRTGQRTIQGSLTREEFRENALDIDDIVVKLKNGKKEVIFVLPNNEEITLPDLYRTVMINIAQTTRFSLLTTRLVGFLEVGRVYIDEPILFSKIGDDLEVYIAKFQL